jgi:hypothetical protein
LSKTPEATLLFTGCFVISLLLVAMLFVYCSSVFWAALEVAEPTEPVADPAVEQLLGFA